HDNSAPVSTSTDLTSCRSPGRAGFSISMSTRKDPISSVMMPPRSLPSSTIFLRLVSIPFTAEAEHHGLDLHAATFIPPNRALQPLKVREPQPIAGAAATLSRTDPVVPFTGEALRQQHTATDREARQRDDRSEERRVGKV